MKARGPNGTCSGATGEEAINASGGTKDTGGKFVELGDEMDFLAASRHEEI